MLHVKSHTQIRNEGVHSVCATLRSGLIEEKLHNVVEVDHIYNCVMKKFLLDYWFGKARNHVCAWHLECISSGARFWNDQDQQTVKNAIGSARPYGWLNTCSGMAQDKPRGTSRNDEMCKAFLLLHLRSMAKLCDEWKSCRVLQCCKTSLVGQRVCKQDGWSCGT